MNTDDRWRGQLEQLSRALADRPSLRAAVTQEVEARSERQLGVDKTRPAAQVRPLQTHRWRNVAGVAAFAISLAAMLLAVLILPALSRPAFAQVQAALRKIRTAVITRELPDQAGVSQRLLVSSDHDLYRMETGDGAVVIQSREGRNLTLNTIDKIAQITSGAGFGLEGERLAPSDFLDRLQSVKTDSVRDLGNKMFDGQTLTGFELPPERGMVRRVWVDPKSWLPVHEEINPSVPAKTSDDPRVVILRPPRSNVTYQFNVELADELFSLDPPDDFEQVDSRDFKWPGRELAKLPDDLDAASYVLVPRHGIGLVHFGMTKQEVTAALGKPDNIELIGRLSNEQQEALNEISRKSEEENWDKYRVNRERNRVMSQSQSLVRASEALMYHSLGFHVVVRDDTGLDEIMCWAKSAATRQFIGKTDLGVSMKSKPADVKRIYGAPTKTSEFQNSLVLYYDKLQCAFSFDGEHEMQSIHLTRSKQN